MKKAQFSNSRGDAASANAARMAAFLSTKADSEQRRLENETKRTEIAAARAARQLERDQLKQAEIDQKNAEIAAQRQREADEAAAVISAQEAQQQELKDRIARVLTDDAVRKAERDRRYAKRKAASARS